MSETIEFTIMSNHSISYNASFRLDGNNLTAWCNCAKSELGQYCVHVLRILLGEDKGVVGENVDKVETVRSWVSSTDVGAALMELAAAEMVLDTAKKEVVIAKEKVAQAIRD
jgi:hypothetical protein